VFGLVLLPGHLVFTLVDSCFDSDDSCHHISLPLGSCRCQSGIIEGAHLAKVRVAATRASSVHCGGRRAAPPAAPQSPPHDAGAGGPAGPNFAKHPQVQAVPTRPCAHLCPSCFESNLDVSACHVAVERISIPTLLLQCVRYLCFSGTSVPHSVGFLGKEPVFLTNLVCYLSSNASVRHKL
jgi:hypothetical protein